ncbi:NAD(P)H-hydrate dehydratase [Microbacterium sp. 4R-513]|uniref:ADP-dependent NAD(P)H-hydrate dehydratase n=1 Tax=Microbacterium sp. 4R-513 TaxID=2567934 RepID=UPI0013E17EF9|nr:ADP/ATP-dependent (S)-NAD(P)H-hydrate dehydratase [Microbacterium sp. 4R-513]QIG38724.1 NAD(P)H-hydrate dehydratase [Microbacterium sp. 4R-513]
MSNPSEITVTPELLRAWGLPDPGDSKKSRGHVVVVGGSRRSPGAVFLAGEAALRVGAGRLAVVVPASVDAQLSVVMPEAAVHSLPEDADEPLGDGPRRTIESAEAVLVGPGFDDPDETRATLLAVSRLEVRCLVLDAYALGILPRVDRTALPRDLVLNPNHEEAAILLDRDPDDGEVDLVEIARRYDAVVNCYGHVVAPTGEAWDVPGGGPGLGTSGSGDVLAGAITGFAARGIAPAQAAVWGAWAHARAGDLLTEDVGIGFLARDIPLQLTRALRDLMRAEA